MLKARIYSIICIQSLVLLIAMPTFASAQVMFDVFDNYYEHQVDEGNNQSGNNSSNLPMPAEEEEQHQYESVGMKNPQQGINHKIKFPIFSNSWQNITSRIITPPPK